MRSAWVYFLDTDMDMSLLKEDPYLLEAVKHVVEKIYIGRVPEDEELLPMFAKLIRMTPVRPMILIFLAAYSGIWPLYITACIPAFFFTVSIYEGLTHSTEENVDKYSTIIDM